MRAGAQDVAGRSVARRLVGAVVGLSVWSAMFLAVVVPVYVLFTQVSDYFVNKGQAGGPAPWLHSMAGFAGAGVKLPLALAAVGLFGFWFVSGIGSVTSAALRLLRGHWTSGTVARLDQVVQKADGGMALRWAVTFTDRNGAMQLAHLRTGPAPRRPVEVGERVHVHYEVGDPDNSVALRSGRWPATRHWVVHVMLGLWLCFAAGVPLGALLAAVVWGVGHL